MGENMSFKFRGLEIHISFNGDEVERITNPIIQGKADKAYIFTFYKEWIDNDTAEKKFQLDQNLNRYNDVCKILKEHKIEVVKDIPDSLKAVKDASGNKIDGIPVSYHDYVEVMQKLSEIIFNERLKDKNVNIHINVAVGSKITASSPAVTAATRNVRLTSFLAGRP